MTLVLQSPMCFSLFEIWFRLFPPNVGLHKAPNLIQKFTCRGIFSFKDAIFYHRTLTLLTILMQLFSSNVEAVSVTISWAKISTAWFSRWCFLTKASLARTAAPAPSDVGLMRGQTGVVGLRIITVTARITVRILSPPLSHTSFYQGICAVPVFLELHQIASQNDPFISLKASTLSSARFLPTLQESEEVEHLPGTFHLLQAVFILKLGIPAQRGTHIHARWRRVWGYPEEIVCFQGLTGCW